MKEYTELEKRILNRETELQVAYDFSIKRQKELKEIIKNAQIELENTEERIRKCIKRAREQNVLYCL